ncbi:MAG: Transposase [Enterococcus gilvus]|jgi:hypothetical protein|uniref:hypothetical protein n=1 Tax=Enterococcus gilvus TaxID=160453 RepID=UPI001966769B|nr:hypothetical protein [Enterococcus gilvus]
MDSIKTDNRRLCVVLNTKLNRFLAYDKNTPQKFAIGVTIEQAIKKLNVAS